MSNYYVRRIYDFQYPAIGDYKLLLFYMLHKVIRESYMSITITIAIVKYIMSNMIIVYIYTEKNILIVNINKYLFE